MVGLETASLGQLRIRRRLCTQVIRLLRTKWANDPRSADALIEYRRQLKAINEAAKAKRQEMRAQAGEAEPEPVVLGMKTLKMSGRARR